MLRPVGGVLVVSMLSLASIACSPAAGGPPAAPVGVSIPGGNAPPAPPGAPTDLAAVLEPIREQAGLPALAAAVLGGDRMLALGAVGVRKSGDPTPVEPGDAWHLGSDTKAMTATLFALYVDAGQIAFTTTLAQAFPDWASKMDPAFRGVTMEMLLAHRGGLAHDVPPEVFASLPRTPGDSRAARLAAIQATLERPPEYPPGTQFSYSNAGYMIVGAALEQLTDTPWETLMRERVFAPLGMKSCGFGAPATPGEVDAPWPHLVQGGALVPVPSGPGADNPPALGPAGTVHCSLADWGKFIAMHLAGARGESRFLTAASFARLHTPKPPGEGYAGGWIVTQRPWAHGVALTHGGSNGMWFANVWIAPALDRAFLVATNRGDETAAQATDQVVGALVKMFSTPPR